MNLKLEFFSVSIKISEMLKVFNKHETVSALLAFLLWVEVRSFPNQF